MMVELARDAFLLMPLIVLSRQPLGVLHPLLLAVIVWPLVSGVPSAVQDFGGWAGVLAGSPVDAPYFAGLPAWTASATWMAIAKYNALDLVRLLGVYIGFAATGGSGPFQRTFRQLPRPDSVRTMMLTLIGVSALVLLYFVHSRGGLIEHLGSLARGRFRELSGEGITTVMIRLGGIALYVWVAARPADVKNPVFLGAMALAVAATFVGNGSRSEALEVPMIVGLIWALRRQKVPWRIALLVAPILFLSLGLLGAIRTASWSDQTATEAASTTSVADSFALAQKELEERRSLNSGIPIVSRAYGLSGGAMWGRTYVAAITAPIPRTLWHGKPRGPDSIYAQMFLHEDMEGRAIPVSETAELFWNFWIVGIFVFAVVYGWFLRLSYMFFWRRFPSPTVIVFYALYITRFHFSTDDLVDLEQLLFLLGVCAVCLAFAPKVAPIRYKLGEARQAKLPSAAEQTVDSE
jgi:hypothetical protein